MKPGKFITVEGMDGAGKSTHMGYIGSRIRSAGVPFVSTREPGGTAMGDQIRAILLDRDDLDISHNGELMLMFASRVQHLEQVIIPALESGTWVLCDRFTDATYAYQGAGRGIPDGRIQELEGWVQQGLQPDLTLLFDTTIESAVSRISSRGNAKDRFEQQGHEFKLAVRAQYLKRASQYPQRIKMINTNESVNNSRHQIDRILSCFDPSTFADQ